MASPPAWSMGKSTRGNMRASGVPGPGSYEPRLHHKPSAPNYRLGTSSRSGERRSDAPGPGTYNSPGKISVSSPQYSLRFRSPQSVKSFVPGPGTYDATGLRGYDNAPPSFSFRMKTSHPDGKTKVPGPGTYDATSRIQNQTSPSFKMGTSKRDNFYNTGNAPGPGAYTTRPTSAFNRESGPKYGFGTADRDSLQGMSKTLPGPGTYDFKGSFEGSTGKGMSLVPRRPDSALSTAARSPGPGAYNLGGKNYGPSYGMGTSPSRTGPSKESMGVPGPGNYEPRPVSGKQNIKIGTSLRSPLSTGGFAPGPGTYQSPSKVGEGPKYIMNPRREENNSRYGPGPGAYNPNVTLTKDHYPTAKMGSSNRGDFIGTKANPGPGQYDVRGRLGGPHWGFGSEMRGSGVKSNSPGPGTYNMRNTVGDVPQYVFGGAPLKIHL